MAQQQNVCLCLFLYSSIPSIVHTGQNSVLGSQRCISTRILNNVGRNLSQHPWAHNHFCLECLQGSTLATRAIVSFTQSPG